MKAHILNGKALAAAIKEGIVRQVYACEERGIQPTLAIVSATNDESANWYISTIRKTAEKVGIKTKLVNLSATASHDEIAAELGNLASSSKIHGIILQTPLPKNVDADGLLSLIPIEKDVDGANPLSAGRLYSGLKSFAPATAAAVMALLASPEIHLEGKHTVVVGRSRIVGKPAAHLLLDQHATVTICHSRTTDLHKITKQADVLVVAIGKPKFITANFVKKGAVVIDVGTNVDESGNLVGDVDEQSVQAKAGKLSPVPGGVGPVTTAILLKQTVDAAVNSQ